MPGGALVQPGPAGGPVRPEVQRALDDEEPVPARPTLRAGRGAGPLADECPVCGSPLRVHDRAWDALRTSREPLRTVEGVLCAGNYCGPSCYEEAWREHSADVAELLRARRTGDT